MGVLWDDGLLDDGRADHVDYGLEEAGKDEARWAVLDICGSAEAEALDSVAVEG